MSALEHKIEPTPQWIIDRRFVLETFAAVSAVALLPLPAGAASSPQPSASAPALLGDWHIDDQWGAYPRYSDPLPYGRSEDRAVADTGITAL